MIWRPIEWYAGLGGFSAAWPCGAVVAAVDINQIAQRAYGANFGHPFFVREIDSVSVTEVSNWDGNFWWLSPPCQPYTRRGRERGKEDSRAKSLFRLIDLLSQLRPDGLAVENVIGFEHSVANQRLVDELRKLHYQVASIVLCPSQFGIPNRRPRYYLIASQQGLEPWKSRPQYQVAFSDLLESVREDSSLWLSPDVADQNWAGLDRVYASIKVQMSKDPFFLSLSPQGQAIDQIALTACFGSSYGKSILRAGSYLVVGDRVRRFSPREVARLLGFPESFRFDSLTDRPAWKLLGNSLSIPVVRYVLSHFQQGVQDSVISVDRLPRGFSLVLD